MNGNEVRIEASRKIRKFSPHSLGKVIEWKRQKTFFVICYDCSVRALESTPDFEGLRNLLKIHQLNGCIVVSFTSSRANLEYRFFAPHKGLLEDNAGSFSLASLCGYKAAHMPSGVHDLVAAQGFQIGKPSELRARFMSRDSMALAVRVGGLVESVS